MTGFPFPPPQNMQAGDFAWWRGAPIDVATIKKIVDLCEALPKEKGRIGGGEELNELLNLRKCSVAWVPFPDEEKATEWLYSLLAPLIIKVNEDHFRFRLWGFMERLQYTVYEDGGEHYGWHTDTVSGNRPPRKLSFSMLLSEPTSFDGGELMLAGQSSYVLPKERGAMLFFPSYTSHRVTPVTKGVRRALVGWVSGQDFQ